MMSNFEILGPCACGKDATVYTSRLKPDGTKTDRKLQCEDCIRKAQKRMLERASDKSKQKQRPPYLVIDEVEYMRADLACKELGVTKLRLWQYLKPEYKGMHMRHFKSGTTYVAVEDVRNFKGVADDSVLQLDYSNDAHGTPTLTLRFSSPQTRANIQMFFKTIKGKIKVMTEEANNVTTLTLAT